MKSSTSELELANLKIKELEMLLSETQGVIYTLSAELKETQKYLIKLAHNQAELTKRISMWPYVPVPERE